MLTMLTDDKFNHGLNVLEQSKYTIEYDKEGMFNIICSGLASMLLQHDYAVDLTEEQKMALQTIINK